MNNVASDIIVFAMAPSKSTIANFASISKQLSTLESLNIESIIKVNRLEFTNNGSTKDW